MKMQILTKKSVSQCSDIIRMNVDADNWHWWNVRSHPTAYTVAGRVGLTDFYLKVKRNVPSFFTPMLYGVIEEEQNSVRMTITTRLAFMPRLLFGLFLLVISGLVIFGHSLPSQFQFKSFLVTSILGLGLSLIGYLSMKPHEKYLFTFLDELFEDDNVILS